MMMDDGKQYRSENKGPNKPNNSIKNSRLNEINKPEGLVNKYGGGPYPKGVLSS